MLSKFKKLLERIYSSVTKNPSSKKLAIFVVGFGLVGAALLVISKAALPFVDFEAESSTLSGTASIIADTNASGGSAIRFGSASVATTMTATLNANTRYQTMDGFGVSVNAHSWNNGEARPALDMLIDQNGSTIFRVVMEMTDWEQTNDNADPSSFNWGYYNPIYSGTNFEELWSTIDYLKQKGIPENQIVLSFMGIGPSWLGGTTVSSAQEDEWVELVVSAAYYGYTTRNAKFGQFSPNNEEDWGHNEGIIMSNTQYARAMNKVSNRLDGLGMGSVRLVGPETAQTCVGAGQYWDQLTTYPNLMAKIDHLSLHDYSGGTCNGDAEIKSSSYPNKTLWMTEFSVFSQAFTLLSQNPTALLMWDGYDAVYEHAILNGLGSQPGNDAGNAPALIAYNASTKVYTPRKSMYQFGQLFKYVKPGAQRVQINSTNGGMILFAFVQTSTGAITIVGQNNTGSTQVIGGTMNNTPAATTFHYTQTNGSDNMKPGADVPINNGTFTVSVPNSTVFTLTTL